MTKQDFVHLYDKSVYQVRLDVALKLYGNGFNAERCLQLADEFVAGLLKEDFEDIQEKF